MEVGSFIELQFDKGREYYKGDTVCRLNSGRAAICHAVKSLGCKKVYMPLYQCETVRQFLIVHGVELSFYNIDNEFRPQGVYVEDDAAILLVNYFGVFSDEEMNQRCKPYKHVIIDCCPAFYAKPIDACLMVYSARKFFGVPDGAYVVGENLLEANYKQDYSSDKALFLLKRIEYGCEGEVYGEREINELRLDEPEIKRMSKLTYTILDGINYDKVAQIRRHNFEYAHKLFGGINQLNPLKFYDENCVPMVYPLLIENDTLLSALIAAKHFQGNWWRYILSIPTANNFERKLSQYVIPITIDQRYNETHLDYLASVIRNHLKI